MRSIGLSKRLDISTLTISVPPSPSKSRVDGLRRRQVRLNAIQDRMGLLVIARIPVDHNQVIGLVRIGKRLVLQCTDGAVGKTDGVQEIGLAEVIWVSPSRCSDIQLLL